jgi:hypothetical protein
VTSTGRRRRLLALVALLVLGGAAWVVASTGEGSATPYGPTSTSPTGAKALAVLLSQLGVRVSADGDLPERGKGVALVLDDQLNDATRRQLTTWVHQGGALVVADPLSPLSSAAVAQGAPDQPLGASGSLRPACDAPWVSGVGSVDPGGDPLLEVPPGSYPCFSQGRGAFAVATPVGAGVVVSLGGPDLWSNAYLAHDDNALLAADLLAPARGDAVAWLVEPRIGGGTQTLWSLVPGQVKLCLLGLLVAGLAACAWRARRLGPPALEEPVVPVPGSELVIATGHLLARNRRFKDAAELLRGELRRELGARLGQPPGSSPATVARVAASRAGTPQDETVAALCGPPPSNEPELLALARSLQRLRQEVLYADSKR